MIPKIVDLTCHMDLPYHIRKLIFYVHIIVLER